MKKWTLRIIVFLAAATMLAACGENRDSRQRIDVNRKGFEDSKEKANGGDATQGDEAAQPAEVKGLFSGEYDGVPASNVLSLYTQAPGNYALSKVSNLIEKEGQAAGGVKIELHELGKFNDSKDTRASEISKEFSGESLLSSLIIPKRLIIDQSITFSSLSVLGLEVTEAEAKLAIRDATTDDENSLRSAKDAIVNAAANPSQAKTGIGVEGDNDWYLTVETKKAPVKFIVTFLNEDEKIREQVILEYKKLTEETE